MYVDSTINLVIHIVSLGVSDSYGKNSVCHDLNKEQSQQSTQIESSGFFNRTF